jgi:acetylornithine deacetylase/succinyl-diaminopimelate desuccinylase-like protein
VSTLSQLQQRVLEHLDEDAMVRFLAEIVNIPSPTGSEEAVATYIDECLREAGIRSSLQRFAEGRANVLARVEGTGGGPTLLLNGHIDTSYAGDEPELSGIGYKNQAVIDGEWMYGNGVHNMKSAIASYVATLKALSASEVPLRGDVILAAVAGEIEIAPYGRYQGSRYEGFGTGTAYALAHGLTADVCILGEPTSNSIGLSNLGVVWIRLRTAGTMAHTQHSSTAINAIDQMERVIAHMRPWMREYRDRHEYNGLKPACDLTAIEGGWPWRASRTPVYCDAFMCLRTPPELRPTTVLSELRLHLAKLEESDSPVTVDMEPYVTHQGASIQADEPVVRAVHSAHTAIHGQEPEYHPRGAYMDSSLLIAHGIPTVVYGPSGRTRSGGTGIGWSPSTGEHTYLPDLIASTRVVGAAAVDICGTSDRK